MTLHTNGAQGLPQPGLDAAREGRAVFGYVNAKTGINAEGVLTDATFLKAIPADSRLVVTSFHMQLTTASDTVAVEFVTTTGDDGTGAVTVRSQKFAIATGTLADPVQPPMMHFDPPLVVDRSDSGAFSARVLGNDASAALSLGYYGWVEAI